MRINRVFTFLFSLSMLCAFSFAVSDARAESPKEILHEYEEAVEEAIDLNVEHYKDGHDVAHYDHGTEIEGLPQLDFTTYTSQIFWMFVAFIFLYIVFSKKTLPEISGTIENRRDKIEGDLDNAKDLKEQAEKVQAEYEAALQDARVKASETFKAAEDEIKANNNARLETFKDRSNKLTQETEASIEKAKEAAMADTQGIAAEIASIAAEKIVGISTDIKQAETLVKNINKKAA